MRRARLQHLWPPALGQQALNAIIFAAIRRFRGAALFRGLHTSPSQGAAFWPSSNKSCQRTRKRPRAAELRRWASTNASSARLPLACGCGSSAALRGRCFRCRRLGLRARWQHAALALGQCAGVPCRTLGRNRCCRGSGLAWQALPADHLGVVATRSRWRGHVQRELHRALGSTCSLLRSASLDLHAGLHSLRLARSGSVVVLSAENQGASHVGADEIPTLCSKE